ncbi:MAG: hypothetical protein IPN82_16230 [Chitinophagaceae bacterium]|nr:hypothetical protein [Chitinophagaceae bacterium]MBP6233344.1 hypothetical protein [Chitinophagaceae bacterium]
MHYLLVGTLTLFVSLSIKAQQIKVYNGRENIFPSSWLEKPIKAKASIANAESVKVDTLEITKAFGVYPDELLQKNISTIFVAGTIRCYGVSYYGTNSNKNIYIALQGNQEVLQTFHHEFSSILLRNYPAYFNKTAWLRLSPELFNTSSAKAIKAGYSQTVFDSSMLAKGYISSYSLSNYENDFNLYAEHLLSGSKTFWEYVDRYEKIRKKTDLIIEFYHKLNPLFGEGYFRALAKTLS